MGSVKSGGCLPDFKGLPAGFVIQVVIFFSDKLIQPVKPKKKLQFCFGSPVKLRVFEYRQKNEYKWFVILGIQNLSQASTNFQVNLISTLPKMKMFAPENRHLEKEIPIGNHHFWGGYVSF